VIQRSKKDIQRGYHRFKADTGVSDEELERIARERLEADALSMVVANDVLERGMGTEDTRVVVVTEKRSEWFEGMKSEVARKIVERYLQDCV
jgi:Phosphopantothenoylcysteine synthetase/decarboxylase